MIESKIPIATVGLGLMGCSIATCIMAAGHRVTSLVLSLSESAPAKNRIANFLDQLYEEKLLVEPPHKVMERFFITDKIEGLAGHSIVIESITEDPKEKKKLYLLLERVLSPDAIIGSNTSAIPVTFLQKDLRNPERLLGIHWAEPAHITRFMEVICGDRTDLRNAEKIMKIAKSWNKEPSLLKKDIRGFITNRIMYAMLREAFFLVENGYATVEDVDRSLRNDLGYWITFAGPFRFMDITGIPAYLSVMTDLFAELDNSQSPPKLMEKIVGAGAKGISNAQGFYSYTSTSAKKWEDLFVQFSYDIRKLAEKYPHDVGDEKPV